MLQDSPNALDTPLNGLAWDAWLNKIEEAADDDGYAEPLGTHHAAVFLENRQKTLLVSFKTFQSIKTHSNTAQPLGWQIIRALNWSHLCLVSHDNT